MSKRVHGSIDPSSVKPGDRVLVHQPTGLSLGESTITELPFGDCQHHLHWYSRIISWCDVQGCWNIATSAFSNPCYAQWPYSSDVLTLADGDDWVTKSPVRPGMSIRAFHPHQNKRRLADGVIITPHIETGDWYVNLDGFLCVANESAMTVRDLPCPSSSDSETRTRVDRLLQVARTLKGELPPDLPHSNNLDLRDAHWHVDDALRRIAQAEYARKGAELEDARILAGGAEEYISKSRVALQGGPKKWFHLTEGGTREQA